jgi:hypothetical protein
MMQETANTLLHRLGQHTFDANADKGAALDDDDVVEFAINAVHRARATEHQQPRRGDAVEPP